MDILRRLHAHRSRVLEDLTRLEGSELAREILDLTRMRSAAEQWLDRGGPATPNLKSLLVFGLTMGRFLIWLEGEGVT